MVTDKLAGVSPQTIPYFHREYGNDVKTPLHDQSLSDQIKRVALVALPFLSLAKPLSLPIALGMGGLRTYHNIEKLIECIKTNDLTEGGYYFLQTLISTASLAATVIMFPVGMILTTTHDLLIEIGRLTHHIQNQDYKKAFESCANIINNALYLACLLDGGLILTIASLATQIGLCLYHGQKEWRSGHWLEAAGHLGMALARGGQLKSHVTQLQQQLPSQKKPMSVGQDDELIDWELGDVKVSDSNGNIYNVPPPRIKTQSGLK